MPPKTPWIKFGDFIFKYRNRLFPVILLGMFIGFEPAHTYAGHADWVRIKDWAAIALTLSGLALRGAVIGFAYIKRGGVNKKVFADKLVSTGFFGMCRNPLYVGNMLIYSGVFLLHGNPYVVVLGICSYFIIYQAIIAAEEYFLRGKFGDEYVKYCKTVPRWGFKFAQWGSATKGMTFNIRRVILKDYTTMANVIVVLLLLTLIKRWHASTRGEFNLSIEVDGTMILATALITAAIAWAKKRKLLTV